MHRRINGERRSFAPPPLGGTFFCFFAPDPKSFKETYFFLDFSWEWYPWHPWRRCWCCLCRRQPWSGGKPASLPSWASRLQSFGLQHPCSSGSPNLRRDYQARNQTPCMFITDLFPLLYVWFYYKTMSRNKGNPCLNLFPSKSSASLSYTLVTLLKFSQYALFLG